MLLEDLGCFLEVLGNLSRATGQARGAVLSRHLQQELKFPLVSSLEVRALQDPPLRHFSYWIFSFTCPQQPPSLNFRDSQLLSLNSWTESPLLPAREPMCPKHGHVRVRSTRPGWTLHSALPDQASVNHAFIPRQWLLPATYKDRSKSADLSLKRTKCHQHTYLSGWLLVQVTLWLLCGCQGETDLNSALELLVITPGARSSTQAYLR